MAAFNQTLFYLSLASILVSSSCNNAGPEPILPPSQQKMAPKPTINADISFFEDNCQDNIDNDQDGLTDCDDDDCQLNPFCLHSLNAEIKCFDGVDNDLDGLTDCEDVDCLNKTACRISRMPCQPNPCDTINSCLADGLTLASTKGKCTPANRRPSCSFKDVPTVFHNCADNNQICITDHCSYNIKTLLGMPAMRLNGYLDLVTVIAINRREYTMMVQQSPKEPAIAISLPLKGSEKLIPGNIISLKIKALTKKDNNTIINGNKAMITAIEPNIHDLKEFVTQIDQQVSNPFASSDFGKSYAFSGILLKPLSDDEESWIGVYGKNLPIIINFPPRQFLPILPKPFTHFTTDPITLNQNNDLPQISVNAHNFHLQQKATAAEICQAFYDSQVTPKAHASYRGFPAALAIPFIPLADNLQIDMENEAGQTIESSGSLVAKHNFWQTKIAPTAAYRFKITATRQDCHDITRYSSYMTPQEKPACGPNALYISQVLDKKCFDKNIRLVELTSNCNEPLPLKDWELRIINHNLSAPGWNLAQPAVFTEDTVLPPQGSVLVGQPRSAFKRLSEVPITLAPYPFKMEGKDIVGLFAPNGTLVDKYGQLDSLTDDLSTSHYWNYVKQTAIRKPGYHGHADFANQDSFSQEWQLHSLKCQPEDFASFGKHQ